MVVPFPITPTTTDIDLIDNLPALDQQAKGKFYQELLPAFYFLKAWEDHFIPLYGHPISIIYNTPPDDPPDVLIYFERASIDIEVTSLTPNHIHQSAPIHREFQNQVRHLLPYSNPPTNRTDAMERITQIAHPSSSEYQDERTASIHQILLERSAKKLKKPKTQQSANNVLLLTGELLRNPADYPAINHALETASLWPNTQDWTLAIISQWNSLAYFSSLHCPVNGLKCRMSDGTIVDHLVT